MQCNRFVISDLRLLTAAHDTAGGVEWCVTHATCRRLHWPGLGPACAPPTLDLLPCPAAPRPPALRPAPRLGLSSMTLPSDPH